MAEEQWWQWLLRWIDYIGRVQTLSGIGRVLISFLVSTLVISRIPDGRPQPLYWGWFGTVFLATFFVTGVTALGIKTATGRWKRWRNPHFLVLTEFSGTSARLNITHYGEPASWEARGRIIKMLTPESANPRPTFARCSFEKDGKFYQSIRLEHEDYDDIPLGRAIPSGSGSKLLVKTGSSESEVPDDGVIIELIITSKPPMKERQTRRCYRISRPQSATVRTAERHSREIKIEEVSCN